MTDERHTPVPWRHNPDRRAKRLELARLQKARDEAAARSDTAECNRLMTRIVQIQDELGVTGDSQLEP
jgi:hypothetical protein